MNEDELAEKLERLSEKLVRFFEDHPSSPRNRLFLEQDHSAGEWGLVLEDAIAASSDFDIPIPNDLLLEIGEYLLEPYFSDSVERYIQLAVKAGLLIHEELLAAA